MILYFLKIHLNYFVICGNKKDLQNVCKSNLITQSFLCWSSIFLLQCSTWRMNNAAGLLLTLPQRKHKTHTNTRHYYQH